MPRRVLGAFRKFFGEKDEPKMLRRFSEKNWAERGQRIADIHARFVREREILDQVRSVRR